MKQISTRGRANLNHVIFPFVHTFLRYSVVGLMSSLIYFVVTHLLVDYCAMIAKNAALLGYFAAIPANFIANRRFAFRSTGSVAPELLRFLLLHTLGLFITYGMMVVFVEQLGWSYLIIAALTVIVVPIVNFVMLNAWVFVRQI
jgi:putative flippase GtrA